MSPRESGDLLFAYRNLAILFEPNFVETIYSAGVKTSLIKTKFNCCENRLCISFDNSLIYIMGIFL